jgi:hypothetical protein
MYRDLTIPWGNLPLPYWSRVLSGFLL